MTPQEIPDATLEELRQAIQDEPPNSDLFQGASGVLFWDTYRARMEDRYQVRVPDSDHATS